jgi:hypothetical protein
MVNKVSGEHGRDCVETVAGVCKTLCAYLKRNLPAMGKNRGALLFCYGLVSLYVIGCLFKVLWYSG